METGTVKWFNSAKGYGFITNDKGTEDVFVHISEVEKSGVQLNEGQKVRFEITENKGRSAATNLELAD